MTTVRKSLHPLQQAAGNTPNLVGPGRMLRSNENLKGTLREVNENEKSSDVQATLTKRKKINSKAAVQKTSTKAVVNDLTCSESPSEKYWERLAEQRRIALEVTLKENEELHKHNIELLKKIELLEEEIKVQKEMVKESETLVEVLKEMVGGETTSDENSLIDDSYEV